MRLRSAFLSLTFVSLTVANSVSAEENHFSGIGAKVGTLGVGVEYIQPVNKYLDGRLGLNLLTWGYDLDESDVSYEADLELKSISVLADYHPWADSFRISAGLLYNDNQFSVTAEPDGNGTYKLNDVRYSANSISSVDGSIEFNQFSPYIGIGWGAYATSSHGWSFNVDLGVMYHGEPDPSLSVECRPGTPAALCQRLRSDVKAEQAELKDAMSDFQWYPVFSVGVSYSF